MSLWQKNVREVQVCDIEKKLCVYVNFTTICGSRGILRKCVVKESVIASDKEVVFSPLITLNNTKSDQNIYYHNRLNRPNNHLGNKVRN